MDYCKVHRAEGKKSLWAASDTLRVEINVFKPQLRTANSDTFSFIIRFFFHNKDTEIYTKKTIFIDNPSPAKKNVGWVQLNQ